jgi:hypothetical protein
MASVGPLCDEWLEKLQHKSLIDPVFSQELLEFLKTAVTLSSSSVTNRLDNPFRSLH